MARGQVLILGCGFTGRRVGLSLLDDGVPVIVTARATSRLADLAEAGAKVLRLDLEDPGTFPLLGAAVPQGVRVLHSVPSVRRDGGLQDPTPTLLDILGGRPSRVVYLSTTGVYGSQIEVDETTPAAPETERQIVRREAEERVAAGPWSSLILRPAAIYGPGRGAHVSIREGRFRIAGDGGNVVSRIHVDDLARLARAALDSELTGAFPVADDGPSTAREIAEFCAELLGVPMPPSVEPAVLDETRRVTRRVDGRAIRAALGIELLYPDYRVGIPASIAGTATR